MASLEKSMLLPRVLAYWKRSILVAKWVPFLLYSFLPRTQACNLADLFIDIALLDEM
jgi:hypothetical protein